MLACDKLEKEFWKVTGKSTPVLNHADIVEYAHDVCVLDSGHVLRFDTQVKEISVLDMFAALCFSPEPAKKYSAVSALCHEVRVPRNSVVHKLHKVTSTRTVMLCAEKRAHSATCATLDTCAAQVALLDIRSTFVKDLILMHTELSLVLYTSDFECKARKVASLMKTHRKSVVHHCQVQDECMTMLKAPAAHVHPSLMSRDIEEL